MPLPPAPTKRAALLSTEAYKHQASSEFLVAVDRVEPRPAPTTVRGDAPIASASKTPSRKPNKSTPPDAAPKAKQPQRQQGISAAATPSLVASTAMPTTATAYSAPKIEAKAPTPPAALAPLRPVKSAGRASRKTAANGATRLFVLDTNVLLHDPTSLFRFEEHDIFLPMIVLEELDGHKKGMTEVARNGRQTSRTLDALVAQQGGDLAKGLKLAATGHQAARGLLYFQTEPLNSELPSSLPQGKADNQILGVVQALSDKFPQREVILVSKDINMRVKARALGLAAEDYENDKTLEDGELLYAGSLALPQDFWTRQSKTLESWQSGQHNFYRVSGPVVNQFYINQFVYFEAPGE
ncbi:MAG: PIN domain-containing protein, partial [Giesbergeria sp.]